MIVALQVPFPSDSRHIGQCCFDVDEEFSENEFFLAGLFESGFVSSKINSAGFNSNFFKVISLIYLCIIVLS